MFVYHSMLNVSYLPPQPPMIWKTIILPSRPNSDVTIEGEGKYFLHMLTLSMWKDLYKQQDFYVLS